MTDTEKRLAYVLARAREAEHLLAGITGSYGAESAAVREVRAWREALIEEERLRADSEYDGYVHEIAESIRARVAAALERDRRAGVAPEAAAAAESAAAVGARIIAAQAKETGR